MRTFIRFEDASLSISLAFLVPYLFFWSKNIHLFTIDQLLFSALLVFVFAVVLLLCGKIILYVMDKLVFKQKNTHVHTIINCIYTAFCFCILAYFFKIYYPSHVNFYLIFFSIVTVGTFCVCFFKASKILNVFLVVMLCFSASNLAISAVSSSLQDKEINTEKSLPDTVTLTSKPNIYLFILESFQDTEMIESTYEINISDFKHFLDTNNFVEYDNVYSNSSYTLMSLCDLFTLKNYDFLARGYHDIDMEGRNIIGGDDKNIVFKILKENGYYIENIWMKQHAYYLRQVGKNLDKVDLPAAAAFFNLMYPLLVIDESLQQCVDDWQKYLTKRFFPPAGEFKGAFERVLFQALNERPKDRPYFLTVKAGAVHSLSNYTWTPENDWKEEGVYQYFVRKSVDQLMPIIAYIIAQDPDAMIILLGDHGPRRFRRFVPSPYQGDAAFDEKCAKFHVTREDIAKDMFNVLLAVRMPGGAKDISQGYLLSPRNLFLHIFNELSDGIAIEQWRQASVAQNADGLVMIKEGKVLQQWQKKETSPVQKTSP